MLSGCSDEATVVAVEVLRADGISLFDSEPSALLRVSIHRGSGLPEVFQATQASDVRRWEMSLSPRTPLIVTAEWFSDTMRLLGASPEFRSSEAHSGVRVILAPPASCETLTDPQLSVPRLKAGFARVGNTAVVVGGEPAGEKAAVEFIDLVSMKKYEFVDVLDKHLGPSHIVVVDYQLMLVVSENEPTFLYDVSGPGILPTHSDLGALTVPAQAEHLELQPNVRLELVGNQEEVLSNAVKLCVPERFTLEGT